MTQAGAGAGSYASKRLSVKAYGHGNQVYQLADLAHKSVYKAQ